MEDTDKKRVSRKARDAWYATNKKWLNDEIFKDLLKNPDFKFFLEFTRRTRKRWVDRHLKNSDTDRETLYEITEDALKGTLGDEDLTPQNFRRKYQTTLTRAYTVQVSQDTSQLIAPRSKNPVIQLIWQIQNGKDHFEQLAKRYNNFIHEWTMKQLRSNPQLTYQDIYSIGTTGLWKASLNATHIASFPNYAKAYMKGELNKFCKQERRIPGITFREGLEEQIADERVEEDLEQKTRSANKQGGFRTITQEGSQKFDDKKYTHPKKPIEQLLHEEGIKIVRQHKKLHTLDASLVYMALAAYVQSPIRLSEKQPTGNIIEEQPGSNETYEFLEEKTYQQWKQTLTQVTKEIFALPEEQQMAALMYGFANRQDGIKQRPPRLRELREIASQLGMTIPQRTLIRKEWIYDPTEERLINRATDARLENKLRIMMANLIPHATRLTFPSEEMKKLEQTYPGITQQLTIQGLYLCPSQKRTHGIYFSENTTTHGEISIRLMSKQGNPTKKRIIIPEKPTDLTFDIEAIKKATEKPEPRYQKIHGHGTLQYDGKEIPYLIAQHFSTYARCQEIVQADEKEQLIPLLVGEYEQLLQLGLMPPTPKPEHILISPKGHVRIQTTTGWQRFTGSEKEAITRYKTEIDKMFTTLNAWIANEYVETDEIPF